MSVSRFDLRRLFAPAQAQITQDIQLCVHLAAQRDDLRLNCRRSLGLLQERTQCLFIRAQ